MSDTAQPSPPKIEGPRLTSGANNHDNLIRTLSCGKQIVKLTCPGCAQPLEARSGPNFSTIFHCPTCGLSFGSLHEAREAGARLAAPAPELSETEGGTLTAEALPEGARPATAANVPLVTVVTPPVGVPGLLEKLRFAVQGFTVAEYRISRKDIAAENGVGLDVLNPVFREIEKERRSAEAEARKAARENDTRRGAVLVFEEIELWPEPVNLAALLAALVAQLARFVVCSSAAKTAAALYVVFTYVYNTSPICPIFAILSPVKGSGKTRFMAVLVRLIAHPLATSNISPAALYRAIAFYEPLTMFIDEIDLVFGRNMKSERAEELRNVLNAGHTRSSALVIRCDAETLEPKAYSTFCPKITAGLGSLPETVTDRSIVVRMARRTEGEPIEAFSEVEPPPELQVLRRKLARWAADEGMTALMEPPERLETLRDRQNDNWRPLLQLAALAGPEWTEKARAAALELSGENDEADDPKLALLHDLMDVFKGADPASGLRSKDIVLALKQIEGKDYSFMTEVKLARNLRGFGVHPGPMRIGGAAPAKGYKTAEMSLLLDRYFPVSNNTPPPTEPVFSVTLETKSEPELFTSQPEPASDPEGDAWRGEIRAMLESGKVDDIDPGTLSVLRDLAAGKGDPRQARSLLEYLREQTAGSAGA